MSIHKINEPIRIVFIGGFLIPNGWKCHPNSHENHNIEIINVYPSPVGSLHDRVCEVFYEIMGGRVDYGQEHSEFHGHNRFGKEFTKGKYSQWNEEHPVYIVGHSYGGITARVLQTYLAEKRFIGYNTDESWVSGIITVNSPLNGALMTYLLGAHAHLPPIVTWGSVGYFLSNFIHLSALFQLDQALSFEFGHWNLNYKNLYSLFQLFNSFLGVTVGSNTDNAAYDMTIHSQCQWAHHLPTYSKTYYFSIIGRISPNITQLMTQHDDISLHLTYWRWWGWCVSNQIMRIFLTSCIKIFFYFISIPDMKISNVDCSHWFYYGWDGLVSCYSQLKPSLPSSFQHPSTQFISFTNTTLQDMSPGIWHTWELPNDHLRVALCCTHSWELIWRAVQEMNSNKIKQQQTQHHHHQHHQHTQHTTKNHKYPLPDRQIVPIETFHRSQISYPISQFEIYLCLCLLSVGLLFLSYTDLFTSLLSSSFSSPLSWMIIPPLLPLFLSLTSSHSRFFSLQFKQSSSQLTKIEQETPSKSLSSSPSPLLPSEISIFSFNFIRFLVILFLLLLIILSPHDLTLPSIPFMILFLLFTRCLEILVLCLFCDHIHENCSILQLSTHFIILCFNSSTPISSIKLFLTSFLFKEALHCLSKCGWIINSSHPPSSPSSSTPLLNSIWWWRILWFSFLSCSILHFITSFLCFCSISFNYSLVFVLIMEWLSSMKEISYAYQVYSLLLFHRRSSSPSSLPSPSFEMNKS